ncbi:hypothetical protein OE88DRAFT_879815 [Heliocybe sulcata]|uniref:ABM domain-containing protein n=1 Tax=Heliocybe sulcata TaxID=5364 RepID=A0A5C3MPH6_9AGAM|nr:hypothetical protein OE88DRAFT_879815 [Heliocybe sulcata]
MTVTEFAVLQLKPPHTWESPKSRTFFCTLAERQSAWSGHDLKFFQKADDYAQIILISGWKCIAAHREWIESEGNQELLRIATSEALLDVLSLVHLDIDFGQIPGEVKFLEIEKYENDGIRGAKESSGPQKLWKVAGRDLEGEPGMSYVFRGLLAAAPNDAAPGRRLHRLRLHSS